MSESYLFVLRTIDCDVALIVYRGNSTDPQTDGAGKFKVALLLGIPGPYCSMGLAPARLGYVRQFEGRSINAAAPEDAADLEPNRIWGRAMKTSSLVSSRWRASSASRISAELRIASGFASRGVLGAARSCGACLVHGSTSRPLLPGKHRYWNNGMALDRIHSHPRTRQDATHSHGSG